MSHAPARTWFHPWSSVTRFAVAALTGLIAEAGLRQIWPASLAAIVAWNVAVVCFLALTFRVIADRSIQSIRRRAARLDTRAWVIMLIVVAAACVSLIGLAF